MFGQQQTVNFSTKAQAQKYANKVTRVYGFRASIFKVKEPNGRVYYAVINPSQAGMTPL